jgi:hypothetical protein
MTTGKPRCGANLRRKPGKTCQSTVLYPNGRCKLHGGGSRAGVGHHAFKHGRFSSRIPAAWGDLDGKLNDPDLRSIALDLVALDHRMGEILERVGTLKGDAAKARAMEEFAGLSERRSNLIDAESRRLERGQSSIPEAQARTLLRAMAIAVKEAAEGMDGTLFNAAAFLADLQQRFDRLTGRSRLRVIQATPAGPAAGEVGAG